MSKPCPYSENNLNILPVLPDFGDEPMTTAEVVKKVRDTYPGQYGTEFICAILDHSVHYEPCGVVRFESSFRAYDLNQRRVDRTGDETVEDDERGWTLAPGTREKMAPYLQARMQPEAA